MYILLYQNNQTKHTIYRNNNHTNNNITSSKEELIKNIQEKQYIDLFSDTLKLLNDQNKKYKSEYEKIKKWIENRDLSNEDYKKLKDKENEITTLYNKYSGIENKPVIEENKPVINEKESLIEELKAMKYIYIYIRDYYNTFYNEYGLELGIPYRQDLISACDYYCKSSVEKEVITTVINDFVDEINKMAV